ncbi:hypothetical protein CMI37_01560 [Candidatus Pacearchaeota archaeon]|nr:hypothetical protein [Candidatus Pacearchaeota archaeon]|tara:strand:+ start:1176 stop:1790 length:615 start_codon:yes stop_codon:yes gene_type:complete
MKVLVACEYSGTVRDAFTARGHDALSCDLLPTDKPGRHHEGDIEDVLYEDWDLIVAHPPCTYLCNSGVRWLHTQEGRWEKLDEAARFFRLFLDHPCPKVCIENPIMHKYALDRIGGEKHTQLIQPWMFGHPEKKATCLWLKGLDALEETNNVKEEMLKLPASEQQKIWYASPSKDRWKLRSTTYAGIAEAMATQWGNKEAPDED